MRRALVLVAGFAAVLTGSRSAPAPHRRSVKIAQVDTSRYPLITAVVIAPGSNKLSSVPLKVSEGGHSVTATQTGGGSPAAIGVAIDVSRSMEGAPLAAAKQAAASFVKAKRPADTMAIYSFGHEANPVARARHRRQRARVVAQPGHARHRAGHRPLRLRDPGLERARRRTDADQGARGADRRRRHDEDQARRRRQGRQGRQRHHRRDRDRQRQSRRAHVARQARPAATCSRPTARPPASRPSTGRSPRRSATPTGSSTPRTPTASCRCR